MRTFIALIIALGELWLAAFLLEVLSPTKSAIYYWWWFPYDCTCIIIIVCTIFLGLWWDVEGESK